MAAKGIIRAGLLVFWGLSGAACADEVPSAGAGPVPEGFVRIAPLSDDKQLQCANHHNEEWHVSAEDGELVIGPAWPEADPLPDALLERIADIPDLRAMRGSKLAHGVEGGWLVGTSAGEFGGALWWVPEEGEPARLYERNVSRIFEWNGGVYAAGGLSHLGHDSGFVIKVEESGGIWALADIFETPSSVRDAFPMGPERLFLLTRRGLYFMASDGSLSEDVPNNWDLLYANSAAVLADGRYAVGMRYAVSELKEDGDGFAETSWLVPNSCARFKVIDAWKGECECIPAGE